MKCREHKTDLSSAAGVCASCLRERLFLLISAQSQSHHQQRHLDHDDDDLHRHSDPNPPLIFPNSVSQYATHRRLYSDTDCDVSLTFPAAASDHQRLFYSTPQVEISKTRRKKSGFSIVSSFTNLFKSKSDRSEANRSESDPRTATTASPMWYPAGSKSKTVPKFVGERIKSRVSHRGKSPERLGEVEVEMDEEATSHSSEFKEPSPWKQTPARRRNSNLSSLTFFLSPLVQASPNRNWSKGGGSAVQEEDRSRKVAAATTAAAFCKNRSRKMADFGRRYNR